MKSYSVKFLDKGTILSKLENVQRFTDDNFAEALDELANAFNQDFEKEEQRKEKNRLELEELKLERAKMKEKWNALNEESKKRKEES